MLNNMPKFLFWIWMQLSNVNLTFMIDPVAPFIKFMNVKNHTIPIEYSSNLLFFRCINSVFRIEIFIQSKNINLFLAHFLS